MTTDPAVAPVGRPGGAARVPVHRGRPGLAARAPVWPTPSPQAAPARGDRCSASAAAIRCWPRRSTIRSSPAPDRCRVWACCRRGDVRSRRRSRSAPTGAWARTRGASATRSTTASPLSTGTGWPNRFWTAAGSDRVWGTMWHGAFENDGFRRAWLESATTVSGQPFRAHPGALGFRGRREAMLDRLADAVAEHLDTGVLLRLTGAPVPG